MHDEQFVQSAWRNGGPMAVFWLSQWPKTGSQPALKTRKVWDTDGLTLPDSGRRLHQQVLSGNNIKWSVLCGMFYCELWNDKKRGLFKILLATTTSQFFSVTPGNNLAHYRSLIFASVSGYANWFPWRNQYCYRIFNMKWRWNKLLLHNE